MGIRQEDTEHHGSKPPVCRRDLHHWFWRKTAALKDQSRLRVTWKWHGNAPAGQRLFSFCRWAGWTYFNTIPFYRISGAPAVNLLTILTPQIARPRWNSMLSGVCLPVNSIPSLAFENSFLTRASLDDVSVKLKSQYYENTNRSNRITRNVELHQVMLWRWNEMNDDLISMI